MKHILIISSLLLTSVSWGKEICRNIQQPLNPFYNMSIETFKQYDDKKLGIGITYSSPDERFSVFKYDLGLDVITDSNFKEISDMAIDEFYKVANMLQEKIINGYDITSVSFKQLESMSKLLPVNLMFVVEDEKQKQNIHFLGLGTDEKCIYKFRYNTKNLNKVPNNERELMLHVIHYGQLILSIEEVVYK